MNEIIDVYLPIWVDAASRKFIFSSYREFHHLRDFYLQQSTDAQSLKEINEKFLNHLKIFIDDLNRIEQEIEQVGGSLQNFISSAEAFLRLSEICGFKFLINEPVDAYMSTINWLQVLG